MQQKYAGLMGDTSEPFVLAGNPLIAIHASGGERAVDAWIDSQRDWSREEVAQMLRELAIEIVTGEPPAPSPNGEEVDAIFEAAVTVVGPTDDEADEDDDDEEEDDEDKAEDDEDEVEDDEDEVEDEEDDDDEADEDDEDDEEDDDDEEEPDDARYIAAHAAALLVERARANLLDRRAAAALRPLLTTPDPARRAAAVDILGALRDRDSVPQLVQLLETTTIANRVDAIAKSDLLERTASALGNIADPAAAAALVRVATASGETYDDARTVAASALAACLAATPEPRDLDDEVLAALLQLNSEDGELVAQAHLAYGRLARQLSPQRRDAARRRLDATTARTADASPLLARHAALALARADGLDVAAIANLKPLLHASLTSLDYDHEYTLRALRCALAVAELLPELVDAKDLLWLTRFHEPDVRARAHALLACLGKHVPEAAVFDRARAATLANEELAQRIAEPHVVGHAALIAEAAARKLDAARAAIVRVVHGVVERARAGDEHLLDPDTAILDAALPFLRQKLDDATVALFDRMLRHSNPHVKWPLVAAPPNDPRLLGGMFYVLSERWSWQARAAREWLRVHEGTAAFEEARAQAGVTSLDAAPDPDDADEVEDDVETDISDEEIVFDDDDDQTN
jgi:hypothetical protein